MHRRAIRIVKRYFSLGYSNHLILCLLAALHGICVSLSTLKRVLQRHNLRRRGVYSSLRDVGECLLVSKSQVIWWRLLSPVESSDVHVLCSQLPN